MLQMRLCVLPLLLGPCWGEEVVGQTQLLQEVVGESQGHEQLLQGESQGHEQLLQGESQRHKQLLQGESQRHEQFLRPPKGFLSPLASSPAFEVSHPYSLLLAQIEPLTVQDLGGFMADHRRDRMVFGFREESLPAERGGGLGEEEVEVLPTVFTVQRTGRKHQVRGAGRLRLDVSLTALN